ncbi:MAG: hypothetical protein ACRD3W_25225, partial [Terriglobales bacterium]
MTRSVPRDNQGIGKSIELVAPDRDGVGRTLLSAAFDSLVCEIHYRKAPMQKTANTPGEQIKINIKSGGQECPP